MKLEYSNLIFDLNKFDYDEESFQPWQDDEQDKYNRENLSKIHENNEILSDSPGYNNTMQWTPNSLSEKYDSI